MLIWDLNQKPSADERITPTSELLSLGDSDKVINYLRKWISSTNIKLTKLGSFAV